MIRSDWFLQPVYISIFILYTDRQSPLSHPLAGDDWDGIGVRVRVNPEISPHTRPFSSHLFTTLSFDYGKLNRDFSLWVDLEGGGGGGDSDRDDDCRLTGSKLNLTDCRNCWMFLRGLGRGVTGSSLIVPWPLLAISFYWHTAEAFPVPVNVCISTSPSWKIYVVHSIRTELLPTGTE